MRCSAAARCLSCVAGPGFCASPRRTPAQPPRPRLFSADKDHETARLSQRLRVTDDRKRPRIAYHFKKIEQRTQDVAHLPSSSKFRNQCCCIQRQRTFQSPCTEGCGCLFTFFSVCMYLHHFAYNHDMQTENGIPKYMKYRNTNTDTCGFRDVDKRQHNLQKDLQI